MAYKYAIQKAMKYKNLDKLEIVTHKIRNKKKNFEKYLIKNVKITAAFFLV
jgi:hypothetical protein